MPPRLAVGSIGMLEMLRAWVFPPACIACDAPGSGLCAGCAPPSGEAIDFAIAGVPAWALGRYEGALREAIVAMKHGDRDALEALARLSAARCAADGALVPLPTSRGRAAQRGFDQSVALARRVAARSTAVCREILEKRGAAQAGRGRRERLAAAERFRLRPGVTLPAVVTVLDDVCTTGATIRDALRVLAAAGVTVRRIVVLARTQAEPYPPTAGR